MPIKYTQNEYHSGMKPPVFSLPDNGQGDKNHKQADFVDESVVRIIDLIGRKGWDLPDIDLTFSVFNDKDQPVHYVSEIKGDLYGQKWCIHLGREKYIADTHCISLAPQEIIVPQHRWCLYRDGSSAYTRYVGTNWEADQEKFYKSPGLHAKMEDLPRTYLNYEYKNGKFVHTNDMGREYDPIDDEPTALDKIEVLFSLDNFLDEVALMLEHYPDAEITAQQKWEQLAKIEEKPLPQGMPSLFVAITKEYLRDEPGFVLPVVGKRLCRLSTCYDTNYPMSELAEEDFNYAFADKPGRSVTGYWGNNPESPETALFKIDLKNANDVYVVDEQSFLSCHAYYSKENEEERHFSKKEITAMYHAIAKTMTPLDQYKNDFEKPIYLIKRPLRADEARNVTAEALLWLSEADAMTRKEKSQPRISPGLDKLLGLSNF